VAAGGATPDPPAANADGGASAVAGLEACRSWRHTFDGDIGLSQAGEAVMDCCSRS
jgi:hypothetical protein